jgi:hypothetical protein
VRNFVLPGKTILPGNSAGNPLDAYAGEKPYPERKKKPEASHGEKRQ